MLVWGQRGIGGEAGLVGVGAAGGQTRPRRLAWLTVPSGLERILQALDAPG